MDSYDNKNEMDRTWSSPSYILSSEYCREDSVAFIDTGEFIVKDNNINNYKNINNNIEKDNHDKYFMISNSSTTMKHIYYMLIFY